MEQGPAYDAATYHHGKSMITVLVAVFFKTSSSLMRSTEVQTFGAILGRAVRAHANETVAHALIKCTCNGGIWNIAWQDEDYYM